MKNYKIWVTLSILSLVFSLSAVVISLKSTKQEKPSTSISNNLCSPNDSLEIKMKIIARQTFNQGLGFSDGIYSLTENDLNNVCIPENFKKEYKIAKECYLSNKDGCSQGDFFEELRKFLEIPIIH